METLARIWQGVPGRKCIVSIATGNSKRVIHHWVETPDEALRLANGLTADDVYFAPSGYSEDRRQADLSLGAGSFWLDIDCGDGKPYPNAESGFAAFTEWRTKRGFPEPSIIVSSGFGLHIYWLLTQAFARDQWRAIADKLKQTLAVDGMYCDPARTADIASLMRLPGTWNHKHGGAESFVLFESDARYTLADIERLLPTLGPQRTAKPALPDDEDQDYPVGDAVAVVEGCQQIRNSWGKDGTPEPLWRAALSVLWRCEQGEQLVLDYSRGDARFDERDTVAKARLTKGPLSCAQFESACAGGCNGCPNKGAVNTPVQLRQKPVVQAKPLAAERRYPWPFDEVWGYRCVPNGVMMDNDDPDVNDGKPIKISKTPIWISGYREAMRHKDERPFAEVGIGYWRSDGTEDYATMEVGTLADGKKFEQEIRHMGITGVYKFPPLRAYFGAYMDEYVSKIGSQKAVRRLGWCDEGYILGDRIVTEKGAQETRVLANSNVFKQFTPAGTAEEWSRAVRAINAPQYKPLQCAILHAAGSVVLELVGRKGATLFLQGESGAGKTTAAKAGLSLFGPSQKLTIDATQGTLKGYGMTLSTARNTPILFDEVGPMLAHPEKIGQIIYMTTNGEPGVALTRSREIRDMGHWTLHGIMTSNRSLTDLSHSELLSAHRYRVIEINAGDAMPKEAGAKLARALDNCGVAGVPLLQRLCELRPAIESMFEQLDASLAEKFSFPAAARFATNSLTCDYIAGLILADLGLISFDVAAAIDFMAETLSDSSSKIKTSSGILEEIIPEWLRRENQRIVQLGAGNVDTALPVKSPIAALLAKTVLISQSELMDEVKRNNVSFAAFKQWADEKGAIFSRQQLAFGTPKVATIELPLEAVEMGR